jgi:hypothetical protein
MLGFSVSEATVSHYLPARSRRPGQSWRTFLRSQAMAFGHCEYAEERSRGDAGAQDQSYCAQLKRSVAAQIATLWVGLRRGGAHPQRTLKVRRISPRSAQCDRGGTHQAASVSGGSRRALYNRSGAALPMRSPPRQLMRGHSSGRAQLKTSRQCRDAPDFITPVHERADSSNSSADHTSRPSQLLYCRALWIRF